MAIWRPSPNFYKGRTQKVTKIVVHWMVSDLKSADAHIRNSASQVSAHYGIENTTVYQWVKESDTAWHARQANPFSIGIEHSATPQRPASSATYATSAKLIASICRRHKLTEKAIEPHNKYVATQCPGTLSVNKLRSMVKGILEGDEMYKNKTAKQWYAVALKYDGRIKAYQKLVPKLEAAIADLKKQLTANNLLSKAQETKIAELSKKVDELGAKRTIEVGEDTRSWFARLVDSIFKRGE